MQLTKDLVPVIYHDFLVSETGIDAPVHTLTLEQVRKKPLILMLASSGCLPYQFFTVPTRQRRADAKTV